MDESTEMRDGLLGRFFGVLGTLSAKELWERSTEHIMSCRFWNCMSFDCVVFAFGAWTTLEKWVMCFMSSLLVVILYSVSEGETRINQSFTLLTNPKQFPRYDNKYEYGEASHCHI